MPALRAHAEDVPLLVEYFIDAFNTRISQARARREPCGLCGPCRRYGWPGNVRELRNVVERAMLLSDCSDSRPTDFAALADHHRRIGRRLRSAGAGRRARSAGAQPGRSGTRTRRRQPDESRGAARTEPGSDPLPDREIRADNQPLTGRPHLHSPPRPGPRAPTGSAPRIPAAGISDGSRDIPLPAHDPRRSCRFFQCNAPSGVVSILAVSRTGSPLASGESPGRTRQPAL